MNKLKLNITEQAKADIRLITRYIAKDNKFAAKEMSVYLSGICEKITEFPDIGTLRPDFTYKNYRFLTVKKHYVIAYRVEGSDLFISRVLATYRDICTLL